MPITNDEEHKAALMEIDWLWGAAEGTEDGVRLDALATEVCEYEDKHWPIEEPK